MGMTEHTVEELLAEIRDSEAREADYRNRAEVAEAKIRSINDENINPKVYKVEDGHPWKQSQWPSLRDAGLCDLCTTPEHLHMQETS